MLDLTQAFLVAAEAAHAAGEGAGQSAAFFDPANWAALGLGGFFLILLMAGVPKIVARALDARADGIAKEIAEAQKLRQDAQKLLAEYEAKRAAAEAEAKRIVEQAHADAESLRQDLQRERVLELARREQMAEERIARAEQQARDEMRAVAAESAMRAAESLLKSGLSEAQHGALVDQGVGELARKFG